VCQLPHLEDERLAQPRHELVGTDHGTMSIPAILFSLPPFFGLFAG
jgi:hypothetical protein